MLRRRLINNTEGDIEIPNFFEQARQDMEPDQGLPETPDAPDVPDKPDDLDQIRPEPAGPVGPKKPIPGGFDADQINIVKKAKEEASVLRLGGDRDLKPISFGHFLGNRAKSIFQGKTYDHLASSFGEEVSGFTEFVKPETYQAFAAIGAELDQLTGGSLDVEEFDDASPWLRGLAGVEGGGEGGAFARSEFQDKVPWDTKGEYPLLKAVGKFYKDRYGWDNDMFWARLDKTITEDPFGFFADMLTIASFAMPVTTAAGGSAAIGKGLTGIGRAGPVAKTLGRVPRFASFAKKMDRAFRVGGVAVGRNNALNGPVPFAGKLANKFDPIKKPIAHGYFSHFDNQPWYDSLDPFLVVPNLAIGSVRGLHRYAKVARTELTPGLESALTASLDKRNTAINALESYIGMMKGNRANLASSLDTTLRDIKVSHSATIDAFKSAKSADTPKDKVLNIRHFKKLTAEMDQTLTESFAQVIHSAKGDPSFMDVLNKTSGDQGGLVSLPGLPFFGDNVTHQNVDDLISTIEAHVKSDPENPMADVMVDMLDALRKDQLDDIDFGSSSIVDVFNVENDVVKRYVRESILNNLTEQFESYDISGISDIDNYNRLVDDVIDSDIGPEEVQSLYNALGGDEAPPVGRLQGVVFNRMLDVLQSGDDASILDWLDKIDSGGLEQLLGSESMEFFDQFDQTLEAFSQIATRYSSGRTSIDEIHSALDSMVGTQANDIDEAAAAKYQEGLDVEDAPVDEADDLSDVEGLDLADTTDDAQDMTTDEINEMLRENEGMDQPSKDMLKSGQNLFTHSYFSQTHPSVREAIFDDASRHGINPEDMNYDPYNFLLSTRRNKGLNAEENLDLVPEDATFSAEPGASVEDYPASTVGRESQGSDVGLSRASPYKSVPQRGDADLDKYNINFTNRAFISNIIRDVFRAHGIEDQVDDLMIDSVISQTRSDFGVSERMQGVFSNPETMEQLKAGDVSSVMEADPVTLEDIQNYAEIAAREISEGRVPSPLNRVDDYDPLRNELEINRDVAEETGDVSRNIDETDQRSAIDESQYEPEPHPFDEFPDDPANREIDYQAITGVRGIQPLLRDREWLFYKPEFDFDDPQSYGWYASRANYFERVLPDMVARGNISKSAAMESKTAYQEASRHLGHPVVLKESDIPQSVQSGKAAHEQATTSEFFRGTEERLGDVADLDVLKQDGRSWLLKRPKDVDLSSPDSYDWHLSRANYFEHVLPRMVDNGELDQVQADQIRNAYQQASESLGLPVILKKSDIPESVQPGESAALRRKGIRNAYSAHGEDLSDIEDIDLITGDRNWLLNKPESGLDSPDSYKWYMSRINYFQHVLPQNARGADSANIVNRHKAAYTAASERLGHPVAFDQSEIPESVRPGRGEYDVGRNTENVRRGLTELESLRNPETLLKDIRSPDRLFEMINSQLAESPSGTAMSSVQKQRLVRDLLERENSTIRDLKEAVDELSGDQIDDVVDDVVDEAPESLDDVPEELDNVEPDAEPDLPEDEIPDDEIPDEGLPEDEIVDEGLPEDETSDVRTGDDITGYVRDAMDVDIGALRSDSYLRDKFTKYGITSLLRFLGGGRGWRGAANIGGGGIVGGMAGDIVIGLGALSIMWGSGAVWNKLKPFVASAGSSDMAVRAFEILANDAVQKGTLRGLRFGRPGVKPAMSEEAEVDEEEQARDDYWR